MQSTKQKSQKTSSDNKTSFKSKISFSLLQLYVFFYVVYFSGRRPTKAHKKHVWMANGINLKFSALAMLLNISSFNYFLLVHNFEYA